MAPGSSEDAVSPSGKPGRQGKDGKSSKELKEAKKTKEESAVGPAVEGKNSALLRKMATDLAAVSENFQRLQADVNTLKGLSEPVPHTSADRGKKTHKGTAPKPTASGTSEALLATLIDAPSIAVAVAIPADGSDNSSDAPFICTPDQAAIGAVDTAQVAKLGYAFSSVPKVALIRMLLENGEQTAAQLGEGAGLTTGSLYHHLRELVHAEVAFQSSRNRYALTPLGRRTTLAMLALQL